MIDFERGVLEQSQSLTTEDLRKTLLYHSGSEESGASGPSEPRADRNLDGTYDRDSDDELVIAPELMGALKQPLSC